MVVQWADRGKASIRLSARGIQPGRNAVLPVAPSVSISTGAP
jgi:hypothetical protein